MSKVFCPVCGKKIGLFTGSTSIRQGKVCSKCLTSAGIVKLMNNMSFNAESICQLINSRKGLAKRFSATTSFHNYIHIDENNKAFKVGYDIFYFENILGFELLENNVVVSKGGIGKAMVGGLLFGGVGAVVGGVTGSKTSNNVCSSMRINISLKNTYKDFVSIEFVVNNVKTSDKVYVSARENAKKCMKLLESISDVNENRNENNMAFSVADEIVKLKKLLDQGIITQEEFDAFKKKMIEI